MRRAWQLLTATDPGLARLRSAVTTMAALLVALGGVLALAVVWDRPVTLAIVGVVVAMIGSIAVPDDDLRSCAIGTALLVPGAATAVALAAALRGSTVLSDAVFVVVMVAAVYLQRWGPRGGPVGMIAFVTYFLTLFVGGQPSQVPFMVACTAVGATASFVVRLALRPRHPARDLRRELDAWSVRAGWTLELAGKQVRRGRWSLAARQRLRRRVLAASAAAGAAEQRLQDSPDPENATAVGRVSDEDLAVRVFDVQLSLERVIALAVDQVSAEVEMAHRVAAAAALDDLRGELRARPAAPGDATAPSPTDHPAVDLVLSTALRRCAELWCQAWTGAPEPAFGPRTAAAPRSSTGTATASEETEGADDTGSPEDTEDPGASEGTDGADDGTPSWTDLSRRALQVAVAGVGAILVGEVLSPSRWFWAVIAAFVVFMGTSTREEALSKGWQRVVGTLAGVGAGVLVASLVGGRTVLSLVVIAACLFLGLYLMRVSVGYMIFFVTTMLGLLYGLMGMFSVGLLLTRLEETAAGAAVGVLAAYVVLPTRARHEARDDVVDVLDGLVELLDTVGTRLGARAADLDARPEEDTPLGRARALRASMATLRTTASPLTGTVAGLFKRTGLREVVMTVGAAEHHARALARTVEHRDPVPDGGAQVARAAAAAVRTTAAEVRDVLADRSDAQHGVQTDADAALEDLRRAAAEAAGTSGTLLAATLRHLRVIDAALRSLARQVGVEQPDKRERAGAGSAA